MNKEVDLYSSDEMKEHKITKYPINLPMKMCGCATNTGC